MTTYADPLRCPDCRTQLPQAPHTCPACALPLVGATAASLFTTLQEADRLLGVLRSQKQQVAVQVGAAAATRAPGRSRLDDLTPYPVARSRGDAAPPATRVRGASVPKILLTLGALCLLVAAVIFLAVAWSWLGVGGRTTVLIGLTIAAFGACTLTVRRDLRTAAESVAAIGLGLLALDVAGVLHAGWLGPVDGSHTVMLGSAVVATGALLVLVATAGKPLTVPALVLPAAILVAGLAAEVDTDALAPLTVTLVVLLGSARLGGVLPSRTLRGGSLAVGLLGWTGLVVSALHGALEAPVTLSRYAGHLDGWPLLAATALAAVVGLTSGSRGRVEAVGYAAAGLVGTVTVLLPALDNGANAATWSLTAAGLLWVVAVLAAPHSLRTAAVLPLTATLLAPVVTGVVLIERAITATLSVGTPFSQPFVVRIAAPVAEVSPLLLVPILLVVAAAGCATAGLVQPLSRAVWGLALGGALAIGAVATLPWYGVPLVVIVALTLAAAVVTWATSDSEPVVLTALGLGLGAALLALPSDVMTAAALVAVCAIAAARMTQSRSAVATVCFPVAFAALVWSAGEVVGLGDQLRALPVLAILGALAIRRPRLELEAASALAGAVASTAAVLLAPDPDLWLAVHLTVAGALVTLSSVVHPSRRVLAWPGGLLLAAATWVRLVDLGVHVPEAYTLPSALVLSAAGIWRLRRDDGSATLSVLAPGLALATVPSLVATLHDPYSVRALLLGLACLGLALGGTAVRWGAPLVVGAATGTLLVLRELSPYAAQVPSWIAIGAAGALLLAVGVTWESRMADVRRASRYVGALR